MPRKIQKRFSVSKQLKFTLFVAGLLLCVEIANTLLGRGLNQFGLIPREVSGLDGILFAPFLHGSLLHFSSNIVPFTVFMFLLLQYGLNRFLLVSLWIILFSGIMVWIFARPAIHIGASGLIFGYFGYLVLAGFLSRDLKLFLISLLVTLAYGGMVFGVLPSAPFVSWESHLFGFVGGLLAALKWGKPSRK